VKIFKSEKDDLSTKYWGMKEAFDKLQIQKNRKSTPECNLAIGGG